MTVRLIAKIFDRTISECRFLASTMNSKNSNAEKQIRTNKVCNMRRSLLNVKILLIAALIVTAIIGVYGIELGIRVSTGNGRFEILGVVVILLVVLFFADLILLAEHIKTNKGKFSKSILSKDTSKLS